ncbi:D-inositol-3-phosphate glycosyltransferase [Streptomyces sp. NPDC001034]|uniref:D-inositol-3-phosphate glycosyltransferase n=1 Tax=Streptomyces sp. NPDC001034 TaxID=3154375 RepID=UPI00332DA26C
MSLRIAMLSVHTSPLHQPGTGDAGGMNVYMVELSRALAREGARVDLFTRCLGEGHPPRVELAPGADVLHLPAGPRRPLPKETMPDLVPDFARALLAATARDRYDVIHSHYWLAGQAGALAAEHRDIPLVHTMHTLARVKNASLAPGDRPEPGLRIHGEAALARAADRLIANTTEEAVALRDLYGADTDRTDVVTPGINVRTFHPADGRRAARARLGLPRDAFIPLFAGRIQPLKGPDILVHSIAALLRESPGLRRRLLVPVIGGLSGAGLRAPGELRELCARLGLLDVVSCRPAAPQGKLADWYRAADVLVMPSRSESFGLVALEAQACGTPVLAAAVGGLPAAVRDGLTGLLVRGHDPDDYARALRWFAEHPAHAAGMGHAAAEHARRLDWGATARSTLGSYTRALRDRASEVGQERRHAPAPAAASSRRYKRAAVPA